MYREVTTLVFKISFALITSAYIYAYKGSVLSLLHVLIKVNECATFTQEV